MQLEITDNQVISPKSHHSAFTDALAFGKYTLVCYRRATNHISGDGSLEVAVLSPSMQIKTRQRLWMENADLRDPKLSVMPNGKLLLTAYARYCNEQNQTIVAKNICWFSDSGETWSAPRHFGPTNWWLWRLRWHNGTAFGFAYNRGKNRIDLYRGHPYGHMECIKRGALSLQHHGKGYPNESDIWFNASDEMFAVIRRDADSYSAMLGKAKAPYTRWQWQDLHTYVGGPVVEPIETEQEGNSHALLAGRIFTRGLLKTAIWKLNIDKAELTPLLLLPSSGDNSYPGIIRSGNELKVSYYSSHIDRQTRVYLARLKIYT